MLLGNERASAILMKLLAVNSIFIAEASWLLLLDVHSSCCCFSRIGSHVVVEMTGFLL